MDKKYVDLFQQLAQATSVSAEQVMDYDKSHDDEEGFNAAQTMRDDFNALHDRLSDDYSLTKADANKLLLAIMIQLNQMQDRITVLRKAVTGYQTDLIPKLEEIIDKAEDDEAAAKMADEKFIIEDNK